MRFCFFEQVGQAFVNAEAGWLDYLKDPQTLILDLLQAYGSWMLAIVALIVFIESGVLFPVLPGDSLLFTLGLLHYQMGLPLWLSCVILLLSAMAGAQVGYWLGQIFGVALFTPDARFLKTQYLLSAQEFFNEYGGRALVLARFIPFVRTFTPLAAGMAGYRWFSFTLWNTVGAAVWAVGLILLGSWLGEVAFIRDNLEIIAILIVFVSILPIIVQLVRKMIAARKGVKDPQAEASDDQ